MLSQKSTGAKRRNLLKNVIARSKYLRAYKASRQSHLLSLRAQRGNLTKDERGYEYEYDYENRIVKITKNSQTKAEFAYDALGRRIQKKDLIDPNNTTRYYYNYNWQVLAEYDGSDTLQRIFIYGNGTCPTCRRIDEVLLMKAGENDYYYAHDHLYSPALLTDSSGTVIERYEYDAYGNPTIWNAGFTTERDCSNYGNPYLFTGRRVDILDSGSLKIQSNRNRYYNYYTGRWLTQDPLGITPNAQWPNRFSPAGQYRDGLSLYEYGGSNPQVHLDPRGLTILKPVTCLGRISDPDYELDEFRVWWRSVWTPPFGWPEQEYQSVNYRVRGWSGVKISVAAGGSCSELVTIFWSSWVLPNHHEVDEKHRGCGGVWQSYGRPCKAYFKCKQKCCYKKREWEIPWKTTKVGVLKLDPIGGIICSVGTADPKKICWDYYFRCVGCKIPK